MVDRKQTATIATLVIVAIAAMTSVAIYVMANQPTDQTEDQTLNQGEPPSNGMPGLFDTRPENQTDGLDRPQA